MLGLSPRSVTARPLISSQKDPIFCFDVALFKVVNIYPIPKNKKPIALFISDRFNYTNDNQSQTSLTIPLFLLDAEIL
jgi:hypothetical protein